MAGQAAARHAQQYLKELSSLADIYRSVDTDAKFDPVLYPTALQLLAAARRSTNLQLIRYLLPRVSLSIAASACHTPDMAAALNRQLELMNGLVQLNVRDALAASLVHDVVVPSEFGDESGSKAAAFRERLYRDLKLSTPEQTDVAVDDSLSDVAAAARVAWRCANKAISDIAAKPSAIAASQAVVHHILALARHAQYVSLPSIACKEQLAMNIPSAPAPGMLGVSHSATLQLSYYAMLRTLIATTKETPLSDRARANFDDIGEGSVAAIYQLPGINLADVMGQMSSHIGFDLTLNTLRHMSDNPQMVPFPDQGTDPNPQISPIMGRCVAAVSRMQAHLREYVWYFADGDIADSDGELVADLLLTLLVLQACFSVCEEQTLSGETGQFAEDTDLRTTLEKKFLLTTARLTKRIVSVEDNSHLVSALVLMHALNVRACEGEPTPFVAPIALAVDRAGSLVG